MDPEMEQIRQRRMQELMAKQGGGGGMPISQEDQQDKEEQARALEEQRRTMLKAVMSNEARERLSRIALVKPEKARAVESMVLGMAQRRQITSKVSEEQLVSMLEQINEQTGGSKPKITIQRRRYNFDDDE
mmetsp:Transcript_3428/g.9149  ORF Transcript_3428/g.9149 Transcript_3428/m.9149 type:complete len:131 (+) Transcript_3428:3424-3816(+)